MRIVQIVTAMLLVALTSTAGAVQWGYSEFNGPRHWASLTPGYAACATGKQQSPIDLSKVVILKDDHLRLHYRSAPFHLRKSAQNLYQDSVQAGKNYLAYNGQRYNLIGIHFHVPSEHRVNGHQYPMEAHLVHQNSDNQLLVLGVFLQEGSVNNYLAALLSSPQLKNMSEEVQVPLELNPAMLQPVDLAGRAKNYYVYEGSLTTPPCGQGVTWLVAKEPVEVSAQQLQNFKQQVTSYNSRPLQKLSGREVGFQN